MMRFGLGVSVALLALGGLAASAAAQTVKFEGCAVKAGEVCTLINPVSGSFAVNGAKPGVPVGKPIRLTGKVVVGPTPCGVPVLGGVKWKKIKRKAC
jgi:hypothetical protein